MIKVGVHMNLSKPQKLIYDMEKFTGGAIAIVCGSMLINTDKSVDEMKKTVNELYRLNDALRIRISEENGQPYQFITKYKEQDIEVLTFNSKEELDDFASEYAKEPLDFYGSLCDVKIVVLPDKKGVLAKLHHFISDAWTLSLIGTQFNKILNSEEVQVYSYADYVTAEEKYIDSKRYVKDKEYFISQFKKCDEVTYISEKQAHTFEAKRATFVIDKEDTSKILAYTKKKEVSAFSLFMSAVSTYMNRVKMNADNFYIGTAVLNRNGVKEQNTMGMFINTAPILIELNNEESFTENLNAVELSALSVLRHQKYNYGDLLEELRKNHNFTEKLYDIMLSYQNAKVLGDEVETTWYHSGMQTESLQIHIDDRDSEGIFRVHYDYLIEKFTEHEIEKIHEHICNILFSAIEDDSKKLYELSILSQEEKNRLLFDFNDTEVDYPRDKCVHQLFEEQVEKNPDKVAVVACDKTLTYKELNEEANRIAHSLIEKGIGRGDIVAFMLPRRSYLITTMLGILKSGAAYMPIDPDYPRERIEYMLEDSGAKFCVTKENICELLSNTNTDNTNVFVDGADNCYCIYTSGSTGKPKGTLLTHSNVANYVNNNNNNNVVHSIIKESYENIVSVTTVGFDIFVTESLLPLANGMEIVLANEEQSKLQGKLNDLIKAKPADVLQTTPTKMKSLIVDKEQIDYLKTVKVIILGGEALESSLVEELKELTDAEIFNIYGPTEATVWVTNAEVKDLDITIGKPIANTQIYIVDKYMKTVPIGVTGELCIAGDCVGAGYLNRPELTAEKFIDNPFGEGKMYKTGDLAYWREDGNNAYVGRNDFQVKIRGLRIELGEIENAISSVDGINMSVVVVRKNSEGRQLICAFYTGEEKSAQEIKTVIGEKLPKYMIPHIFTHLDEMPLTSSGKISRKTLPEIDLENIETTVEYVAPETEEEQVLVDSIKDILGCEKVSTLDNFFDIGGDSLKAIELTSKLESRGYDVQVKTIFDCETIQELAKNLIVKETETIKVEYGSVIPATPAQMRVYTAQSMNSDSTLYNIPYVFKVEEFDIERLQSAVNKLIERHESLRTHFENQNGHIMQVIDESANVTVEKLLSGDVLSFVRPFDLTQSTLLRVGYHENTVMIDIHHIISDGGTMPVFLKELNELYMGRELEDNGVQYGEFAVQKVNLGDCEKYWLSVFDDEIPVLELPTDIARTDKQSFNGSSVYDVIDIDLHNRITAKCKELNITPYVFYMSCFNILLSKFSGNEDIVVGMPVSGRSSHFLNTIGMFVNTVALRSKPEGTKAITAFLNEVKVNSISAIDNQNYPFGELVKKLGIETNGRNPLFDVMFAYQSEQMTDVIFGDKKAELLPVPITSAKCDFTFNIMPRNDDVVVMVEYCTDLYKEKKIQKFVDAFKLILEQCLTENTLIKDIEAMNKEEKNTLLFDFNDTAVDYPRDKCVHQLFEEQAEKAPDKIAVVACDKTLTYKELNEEANRIAHSLVEKGIGNGDIVAFMLPRRSYLLSTMLGILKSGAAYMPIDPDYPQDRIDYMIEDSGAKLCVTAQNISELLDNSSVNNPDTVVYCVDNCYCIYTSGSTGKPKGTLLTHSNVVNYVNNNNNNVVHSIIKESYKNIVSVTTVGFDIFVTESLLPLANGMEIILASEEQAKLQSKLNDLIKVNPTDVLQTTPTKMKSLIVDKEQLDYLKTIKVIILGGEALESSLVEELKELTDAEIFNIYGPTEATVWVTNAEIKEKDITIGKPIANTQIYIVDKYMKPVPIGVTGELCIAGDCVGAGYLNRPELTAEKFIDNPFGEGKMYKTGDLAYWRKDGNIAYVGRNDFQVKIRGLRIELGEIENAISSVDGINMSVVVVRKNSEGRQLICAFYTGEEKSAQEIKAVIAEKLPKYMLPHIFTHLDEMPLTSSGKISRKTLPEIDLENIETAVEYIAPKTEKEQALVDSVKAVLGCEKVSTLDNFFDIGGDSLKAIELTSQLESKGYDVQVRTIFDCDTVQDLAKELTKKESETAGMEYGNVIPATPAQMRVYTAQSKNGNSTLYNIPYVFKVESLDVERLQSAVNKLIERHESLRTHFENQNGHIMQVIDGTAECVVEKVSLLLTREVDATSSQTEGETTSQSPAVTAPLTSGAIFEKTLKDFIRPFDLEKSPLLRVGYYENTVMIDIHHIISDGGTMPIFFKELNELYMGRELEDNTVQYGEFAVQKVNLEESEKYWLSVFDDEIPVLELPTDIARTDKQSFDGSSVYDVIDIDLHNKITAKCKELNITPYVFYMSCFNILLSKFSGNEDIVVGMPVSGRESHFLNTIGMFVNTIALRNKPEGNKTVIDLLNEVKANSVAAIDNQNYPFGELVKKLNIETSGRNPLFDVMFAYQSEQMTDVVFGDKKAELLPVPITSAKCDFTFNIMPRKDDVVVMVEYCTDLYKEKKIQKFVDAFKLILEQCLGEKSLIQDIEAMGKQEKQTLMFVFNDTAVEYSRDKCVHQLFEEQAEKNPDKVAVVACDKTLTYNELNEEANRIAHSLLEKGIGRGDIVAFMLPRRSYLLSTMIGILKSGAAYMPIDPDYPRDRIEYMLTESNAKYCVDESNIAGLLANTKTINSSVLVDSNDIFCALHTSGSTGKPKMSLLKHGGMMNFITANSKFWQDINTVVSATIVTFDAFQMDSVLSIAQGKQLVLANEDEIYNQILFERLFEHSDSNMFFSTPTKIENYIESSNDKKYLSKIKSFVIGGEVFSEHLLELIKNKSPNSRVYNIYGPTETTVCVMVDELKNDKEITIGKPIANTQIYIVDKYMKPVPVGVTGELCIAGDCVGAGYLNRPELTAEKFIDNPFSKGKMYKTGDLAYWREDGNIAYVGRNDFQVKIRGLRIELGEIENAISSVDGINMSVVVVRKNSEGRQLICAFYTGEEKSTQEIKAVIGEKLPKYMLPHIFTHLDEMPLTSSGKINRNTLPEINLENIESTVEYVAPETYMQKELCKLVESVLNTTPVGITDDFFDLGGDSLKAIEFVSKAHNEGIYFNLQNVFDYPNIKALYECIENGDKQVVSFADIDFAEVNKVLEKNKVDYISAPQKTDVGNILLAGATGYLGIHILADYLDNDNGIAYCLVRGKNQEDSERRFNDLLKLYFGDKYNNTNRIIVVCSDLQKDKFGLSDAEYNELTGKIDTVINCAASVKHYGSYKYFYEANVETTKRLIDFCKLADAKLIHTSTLSVSGNSFADSFDGYVSKEEKHFYESSLYIEQPLDNVYGRSKFEAEKAVLDAIVDGLDANIMRMGNLTNRLSDGQFQKNHESNAFLQRVKSILELGVFPDYLIKDTMYSEFTPIDEAASAVMTIARHFNSDKTVFHINSTKVVHFDKLFEIFNNLEMRVNIVDGVTFTNALRETTKQAGMEHIFETFINDMDENDQLNYDSNIRIENDFTVEYLRMLGFEWADIGFDYLCKYVNYFKKIEYLR